MWTQYKDPKTGQNTFITEASDGEKSCPICKREFDGGEKANMKIERDIDHDIVKWEFHCCRCKNNFVVFND